MSQKDYVRTQRSACCLFLSGIPVSLKNGVTVGVDPLTIIEYLVLERIRGGAVGDLKMLKVLEMLYHSYKIERGYNR